MCKVDKGFVVVRCAGGGRYASMGAVLRLGSHTRDPLLRWRKRGDSGMTHCLGLMLGFRLSD